MFDFLQKYLMGPMSKLSQFRMVRAIQEAGMASVSFTIVGSMVLVISILPDAIPALAPIWAATFDKFETVYMIANHSAMGAISLYFLIGIAYEYTRIWAEEDEVNVRPLNGVLMAVFMLLMLVPQIVMQDGTFAMLTDEKASVLSGYGFGADGLTRLGSSGLFTAILVAWASVRIYVFAVQKNIVIKLPDAVPDGVARSFTAIVPACLVLVVSMIIQAGFALMGTDLYQLVAIPFGFVTGLTDTWLGLIVIYLLIHLLWIVGIHGANIIGSFLTPIGLANFAANAAGTGDFIFAGDLGNPFVHSGGSGATLGLCIMMLTIAKSDQLKYIGRAAIVPGLFNINEPILFGLPIVYNPNMMIPFVLAPVATVSVTYWAMKLDLVSKIIANCAWCTPGPINAFLGTGGDWRGIILSCINIVIAAAIYFPFFKAYDNKLYKEEQAKMAAEAEA